MDRNKFLVEKFKIDLKKEAPYFVKLSRWKQLPYLIADMNLKVGAEIGVEQGKYADCLLRKIPNLKLYAIDCWEAYPEYREKMQDKIDGYYQKTQDLIGHKCEIVKKYSMDAVQDFEDESLDFVYIDSNHNFQSCANDIVEWSKKVKKGGLVSGHDFCMNNVGYERTDVEVVVRAWAKANDIKIWFVTKEGDRCPSWFWIKQ